MLSFLRSPSSIRRFSVSARRPDRAIVYGQNGTPTDVLRVLTYPDLNPSPAPSTVNIRLLLSPINPADINVIEGVYPSKPAPSDMLQPPSTKESLFVGGNEGLARVTAVGAGVSNLKVNDWVILTKQQAGTWATARNVGADDVAKVPDVEGLTEPQVATITVNPPTAYNMLADFATLEEGDWVIQNGANSAVGQAVIQIAAARGLKTINLIRDRADLDQLKKKLYDLGATHVYTYEQLEDKTVREEIKSKKIRLGLNCVGGKTTTAMARLLGSDAHLVSYGAMAKEPLSLPVSLFIFKNLTTHGFWQSRWYKTHSPAEREALMQTLVTLMKEKKLKEPEFEVLRIGVKESDEEASTRLREVLRVMAAGQYGKKVLLKVEHEDDAA